jgi:hypothetical protein
MILITDNRIDILGLSRTAKEILYLDIESVFKSMKSGILFKVYFYVYM